MRKIHSIMQTIHRKPLMVAEMHQLADIGAATINITIVNMLNINNNFTGIRIAYINAGAYLQNSSP